MIKEDNNIWLNYFISLFTVGIEKKGKKVYIDFYLYPNQIERNFILITKHSTIESF